MKPMQKRHILQGTGTYYRPTDFWRETPACQHFLASETTEGKSLWFPQCWRPSPKGHLLQVCSNIFWPALKVAGSLADVPSTSLVGSPHYQGQHTAGRTEVQRLQLVPGEEDGLGWLSLWSWRSSPRSSFSWMCWVYPLLCLQSHHHLGPAPWKVHGN